MKYLWLLFLPALVSAQDTRFLQCDRLRFSGTGCAPPVSESAPELSPPSEPLFPPETVARDMPPPLLRLMNVEKGDPQERAMARQYLTWKRQRWQRMQEVEALLQQEQTQEKSDAPSRTP